MKIDIVVPFVHSACQDEEIKFVLRGVEQNLTDVGNIYIIGVFPRTLNIHHPRIDFIPYNDNAWFSARERNVHEKILKAVGNKNISDPFLLLHDDHFINAQCRTEVWPMYYSLTKPEARGLYENTVRNTQRYFDKFFGGAWIRNYNLHCPMLIYKQAYLDSMRGVDWALDFGYCIKSIYGNFLDVTNDERLPRQMGTDLKIRTVEQVVAESDPVTGSSILTSVREWFSMGDFLLNSEEVKAFFQELYPVKSQYEK